MEFGPKLTTTCRNTPQLPPGDPAPAPCRNNADTIDFELWSACSRTKSAYMDINDDSFLAEIPEEVLL